MKTIHLVFLCVLCVSPIVQAQQFHYVSPKPGSILVSNETSIILRSSVHIDKQSLHPELFLVSGSRSGYHSGKAMVADDGRTVMFIPAEPFAGNETVEVFISSGLKSMQGALFPQFEFTFTTMETSQQPMRTIRMKSARPENSLVDLPAPPLTINALNDPSPGYIFLATWDRNAPLHKYANYLFILDSNGTIVDSTRVNGAPFDFQIQPNGRLSYGLGEYAGITPGNSNLTHYVLDTGLAVVDSFQMKNGYLTDFHDFIHLPNGHAMLMSYHTVTYDMSKIVPGGRTDALLVINVFQEQDAEKNVVFEWRDIDYIPITDTDLKLTDPRINPSTLNAFELDTDGNLLFSFRNHSDIMKISRETGEVMWRLGGLKNEFTFIGEHQENAPYYFARQHDIHRLPNGNISLFDNGEFHSPWYSRAAEYALDEVNKTATLVSEYRYPSGNISTQAAGNAHRLSNGGWFVGYGILDPASPVKRNIVESHSDGSTAFELSLPTNVISYRVSKQPWRKLVNTILISNAEVQQGNTYTFDKNGKTTGVSIKYIDLTGDFYNSVTITRIPYGPVKPEFIFSVAPIISPVSVLYAGAAISSHTSELHIALSAYPEIKHPERTTLLMREFEGQGLFVELPTMYDSIAHELIATTTKFGEIVFANSDLQMVQAAPVLIGPGDSTKTLAEQPLTLSWGGHGLVESFKFQIAADSLFTAAMFDTTTKNSFVQRTDLQKGQQYFWRVRAIAGADSSPWSETWSFTPSDKFIKVLSPNGGEQIQAGKAVVVRWETNITDSVMVLLKRGTEDPVQIGKTSGANSAWVWNVSAAQSAESSYSIVIASMIDTLLMDSSDSPFGIFSSTGVKRIDIQVPEEATLLQNYPNPFNPATIIRFAVPHDRSVGSFVNITVYDMLGRIATILVNEEQTPGWKEVQWNADGFSSGMYFYRLKIGSHSETRRMILMK